MGKRITLAVGLLLVANATAVGSHGSPVPMPGFVTITTPTSNPTYSTSSSQLYIDGTASGGATFMTCSNPGVASWSAINLEFSGWQCYLSLAIGVNVITVTSDVGGSATLIVTYTPVGWTVNSNQTSIAIPLSGPGSPYPSTVTVAGMTGTVQHVVVRLSRFSHTYPSDVTFVLVGPGGQALLFMDGLGGSNSVSNLSLIFDDAAASVPGSLLTAGTFRPASNGFSPSFPAPGPPSYGVPAPAGLATFASVFNGTNPNGVWSLYALDLAGGQLGTVAGGWTLGLRTTGSSPTPMINVTGDLAYGTVPVNSSATRTMTITNTGTATLTVTNIAYTTAITGSAFSGTIAPGGSQIIAVTFAPLGLHGYGGTITVNSDKTSGTNTIIASGTGGPGVLFDFTFDTKSDVLWRHTTGGHVWLWPMNGALRLSEDFVQTVPDTNWEIRGLSDHYGNGRTDILWRNKLTGGIVIWGMNRSVVEFESFLAIVDPSYDIVGTGDYDGDGRADILWQRGTNGEVWIWPSFGAVAHVDTEDPVYQIVGSGDFNGDGKSDILWRHSINGDVWVWLMNGTTRLGKAKVGSVPDLNYQVMGVADYTGDHKADILWRHNTQGHAWIWPMDGTTLLSQTFVATVDPIYKIVGTGDYNGDSKADILWHHSTVGDVWVWLMNGTVMTSQTLVGKVADLGYQIVKWK